jgi:hypothetical protein
MLPVLALLFFLLIMRIPYLIALIWDSFLIQQGKFSYAQSHGDVLTMVASTVQMLILTLPLLASVYLLYSVSRASIKAVWKCSQPTLTRRLTAALGTAIIITFVTGVLWVPLLRVYLDRSVPEDVQSFGITERAHVQTPVSYPQTPPVGGYHAPTWQNCGFYDTPIANENVVHSLEHGAVWITYRSDLPNEQIDSLRQLARRQPYVIVSPLPGLSTPVVASAWARQLPLDSASDPRLNQFVRTFRLGPQAPERGGPCTGGIGAPKK